MPLFAALSRPFKARALPGLLLIIFPVIEFFAMGYKLLCASTAMRNIYDLPLWKDWKRLFLFGLGARIIQALWLTPAAAVFFMIYLKLRATQDLQTVFAVGNLLIWFFALLVVAAIFAPASILNYVAESRFKAAFSFSMLKRMASGAYAIGWLVTGIYTIFILIIFFSTLLLIATLTTLPTWLIGTLVLLIEVVFFWFPGITIWTLLGEAWGKAMQREYTA